MNWIDTKTTDFRQFIYANRWMLLIIALLVLIAYGFNAFNFLLLTDDWLLFQIEGAQYELVVQHGRWLYRVLSELFGQNYPAPAFTLSLLLISAVASAGLQIKTIGLRSRFSWFIFIAVFMLYPFWVETMPFGSIHMRDTVSVFAAGAYGYLAYLAYTAIMTRNFRITALYVALGVVLFSMSASSYQPYIFMGAIAYLFGMINSYVTGSATVKDVLLRFMVLAIVVGLGIILFVVQYKVSMVVFNVSPLPESDPRSLTGSLVSSFAELQAAIEHVGRYLEQFFFRAQHLFPAVAKYIFLIFLATLIAYVFVWKIRDRKFGWGTVLIIFLCLILIFMMPWMFGIIRTDENFRYPVIIANASIYAGIMAITLERAGFALLKWVLGGLSIFVIVMFMFQQNSASLVLHSLNTRDMAIASRIIDRIETDPNYPLLQAAGVADVIFTGHPDLNSDRPFSAVKTRGPMNWSLIQRGILDTGPKWLGYALNRVQSGSVMYEAINLDRFESEQKQDLQSSLASMPEWPEPESIAITDDGRVLIVFEQLP